MSEQAKAPVKELPQFKPPKKKKKWLRRLIVFLILAALLAVALFRCKSAAPVLAGGYLPAKAEVRDMTVAVTGPGTVRPNDTYRATTLIRGEILSAPFEEGDAISKDDVLFTLDATDVENSVRQAETSLEQTRDSLTRAESGVVSSQLALESAQLQYNSLLRTWEDNRLLKANAAGVVNKLHVEVGDTLTPGTLVADILDRQHMKLELPFHTVHAAGFYLGQSAAVTVSGTVETLPGTVTVISPTDAVGPGGTLVRTVTVTVDNPGALSPASVGSASVDGAASAASGSFRYAESKQLFAAYSGKLGKLLVKEGDWVAKDQPVLEYDGKDVQDQLENARIGVENAKLSLEGSRLSLKDTQLSLQSAQDNLDHIRDSLEDYTITSPIDGTVIEKNYKAGDNIDPSNTSASGASAFMAVIYDMSRLTFDINVSEMDITQLKVGQKVTFTADALKGKEFTGVVEKVNINGSTVNGSTSYPVTVAVDGSGTDLASQGLLPGMRVSAKIIVEEAGSLLCVPVDAVQRDSGGTVLVALPGALDANGELTDLSKTEERQVQLGRNDEEYIEVLSGLSEGETVLIRNSASSFMAAMTGREE